jgi:hypothetical protein
MEEKEIQKPLILEIDEAKLEIVQCVNNIIQVHKLPFYIIDMLLSDIGSQIKNAAKDELKAAREQMNNGEEVA